MRGRIRIGTALATAAVTALGVSGCSAGGLGSGGNGSSQAGSQGGSGTALGSGNGQQTGLTNQGANPDAQQTVAAELRLVSATPRATDLNDQRLQYVTYTFSQPVKQVSKPSAFALTGYNTTHPVHAKSAALDEQDPHTVVVGFPAGTPVQSYTLAVVGNGAVQDVQGETALQNSVQLGGSSGFSGLAAAPEITSVKAHPTLDQATFTFDEPIEAYGAPGSTGRPGNPVTQGGGNTTTGGGQATNGNGQSAPAQQSGGGGGVSGAVNAARLGFYTPSGQTVTASKVVAVEGNKVTVSFKSGGPGLDDVARWFAGRHAAQSLQGQWNLVDGQGGTTNVPDLTTATAQNGASYAFTFDEPVKNANAHGFVLYTNGGQQVTANAVSTTNDAHTVVARFRRAANFGGQITAAAVLAHAVQADDAGGASNTVGLVKVQGGAAHTATGPSSGPDLLKVSTGQQTGTVVFHFDEPIKPGSIKKGGFFVVTKDGRLAGPRKVVTSTGGQVTGTNVVVLFDEADLQSAQAFTVNAGAVTGTAGTPNPVHSIYAHSSANTQAS